MRCHHHVIGAKREIGISVGALEIVVLDVDLVEMRIEDFGIANDIVVKWI
jgi:hypothetical protein